MKLKNVIKYAKLSVFPIFIWPPPLGSSPSVMRRHDFLWWFPYLMVFLLDVSFFYSLSIQFTDFKLAIKLFGEICPLTAVLVKMAVCRVQQSRLQVLIAEMEAFLEEAKPDENELMQSYVDRCIVIHAITFYSGIIGCSAFIIAPWITSQNLPADVIYPFSIEATWVWVTLYILQSINLAFIACTLNVDFMFAILLWYTVARFDMLARELRKATNAYDVRHCVQTHQKLIEYAEKLEAAVRYIILYIIFLTIFTTIGGGFVMISGASMIDLLKFGFVIVIPTTENYLFAWPADQLMEISGKIGEAAYESDWIGNSPGMIKDVQIIIRKSQDPIVIRSNRLLPVSSLEFFASTMSAALSYFTTLRAMTTGDN